jgi:hypothetical protein
MATHQPQGAKVTGAPPAGIPGPTRTEPAQPARRLPRRWRNLLLTTHIAVAVGALGTDTILLALGVTGLVSNADLIRAAYLAMDLLVSAVLLPLALAVLGTGILLGLGTQWGLARHYWVLTKLILTIVLASAAVFLLRPSLNHAAANALALALAELPTTGIGQVAVRVTIASIVGVLLLTTAVVLAVYKPSVGPGSAATESWSTPPAGPQLGLPPRLHNGSPALNARRSDGPSRAAPACGGGRPAAPACGGTRDWRARVIRRRGPPPTVREQHPTPEGVL